MGNAETREQATGKASHDAAGHVLSVNVYNLQPRTKTGGSPLNQNLGFGIFHSGIEIMGKEWSFGGIPEALATSISPTYSGIFPSVPKSVLPRSQFYESVVLGLLPHTATEGDIFAVVRNMGPQWTAASYNILKKNCNHFCEAFRDELVAYFLRAPTPSSVILRQIPSYVNRAARFADICVPEKVLQYLFKITPKPPQPAQTMSAGTTEGTPTTHRAIPREADLRKMSISQLKTLLVREGWEDCLDKEDLVQKLLKISAAS